MCGIHGITTNNKLLVQQMIDTTNHRGPDGSGIYIDNNITIGHNLLAITEDAKKSKQPWIVNNRYILSYNGEIYNYKNIQNLLREKNIHTKTSSDTEILALALQEYGWKILDQVDGMYTFCWYDKQEKKLVLARDSSGVKPLYYTFVDNNLVWSSSIQTLLECCNINKKINPRAVECFSALGFMPGPETFVSSIKKLYPGQVLGFHINDKPALFLDTYIQISPLSNNTRFDLEEYCSIVNQSVNQCLMGRRPIGLFLSGGLDSTTILYELYQLQNLVKTFTCRFESHIPKYNQHHNSDANEVQKLKQKFNLDHREWYMSFENYLNFLEEAYLTIEEPHGNFHCPSYYLLNKIVSQNDIVVTLSGDGGDESLSGYACHLNLPPDKTLKDILSTWVKLWSFNHISQKIKNNITEYLLEWFPTSLFGPDRLNNELLVEHLTKIPDDLLTRMDRYGMRFSMEGRFPFTTKLYKEYVLNIPSSHKGNFKGKLVDTKQIPRKAYQNKLPKSILEKKKSGWGIPKKEWLWSNQVDKRVKKVLTPQYYDGIFSLLQSFDFNHPKQKMFAYSFQLWTRQHLIYI